MCPFRNTASSHQTCPSDSRPFTCVSHLRGLFFPAPYLFATVPITALPQPPPPQRLSKAAPFVIGISLMKKGWCLSHYSYSEWEDLRTNLLALTREDTSLHQEVHFPAACGNKRTRFVLTLIRWENREFPKEIKKGKRVRCWPVEVSLKQAWCWSSGRDLWFGNDPDDSRKAGRQMRNQQLKESGVQSSRCGFESWVLRPWVTLDQSLIVSPQVYYQLRGWGGTRQNKVSPRILLALRFPYSINGTLDYLKLFFLFGVSFYLWQQIRNSSGIKEHGMEIIWLLQLKRSTRFRNVLQACTVCMET